MKERNLYLSVYLDVQAYDVFFQTAGSRLHGRNVDGINAISEGIRSGTRQTFNHKIKGKQKGEYKV